MDEVNGQKERVSGQMSGLMLAFEDSKLAKLGLFGEHLRAKYREQYVIEFKGLKFQ